MKIGSVCYATSRGLGHLCKSFYDHNIVTDVCVVRHDRVPTNDDWYPGAPWTPLGTSGWDTKLVNDFCASMDAMLFFETPFDWRLMDFCKAVGVRTYLITMYECTPITHRPPHRYLCPSLLDMQYFPDNSTFIPLPIEHPWTLRKTAKHYIHNGGYLGIRGREGTTTLIEAMQYVKSPLRLTIRVQENVKPVYQRLMAADRRITYIAGTVPYEELYGTGDVCVQPQKWNGCSLPLQEACAAGLLMMTTNRFPMNTWLPKEPLIPVARYIDDSQIGGAYLKFQEAVVEPKDLAATMDQWYGQDIEKYSILGKEWAERNSWEVLKPIYLDLLSK